MYSITDWLRDRPLFAATAVVAAVLLAAFLLTRGDGGSGTPAVAPTVVSQPGGQQPGAEPDASASPARVTGKDGLRASGSQDEGPGQRRPDSGAGSQKDPPPEDAGGAPVAPTPQDVDRYCGGLSRSECRALLEGSAESSPSHPAGPRDCAKTMTRAECEEFFEDSAADTPSHPATPQECVRVMSREECKKFFAAEDG